MTFTLALQDAALQAAEHQDPGITPYIVAAIAVAFFVTLGVVTHSFRDVANRHSHKLGSHDSNAHH